MALMFTNGLVEISAIRVDINFLLQWKLSPCLEIII